MLAANSDFDVDAAAVVAVDGAYDDGDVKTHVNAVTADLPAAGSMLEMTAGALRVVVHYVRYAFDIADGVA